MNINQITYGIFINNQIVGTSSNEQTIKKLIAIMLTKNPHRTIGYRKLDN